MELVSLGRDGIVRSGEILSVDPEANGSFGRVTLAGAVQLPGTRPLGEVPTLARLIRQASDSHRARTLRWVFWCVAIRARIFGMP